GHLPLLRGISLTKDDEIRRNVITQLICHFELKFATIEKTSDITQYQTFDVAQQVGARILIVEDNIANQVILKSIVKRLGHSSVIANHGVEAIEYLKKENFDLIFMDCHMPVMDGFEATRQIRSQGSRIPIVALTAYAMPGDREQCLAAGMDNYLAKPFNIQRLTTILAYYTHK
ncbi:hypothetical protein TI03_06255, partial [Achromatium sp. WMS1]